MLRWEGTWKGENREQVHRNFNRSPVVEQAVAVLGVVDVLSQAGLLADLGSERGGQRLQTRASMRCYRWKLD